MSIKEPSEENPQNTSGPEQTEEGTSLQVSTPAENAFNDPAFSHLPELKVSDLHFRRNDALYFQYCCLSRPVSRPSGSDVQNGNLSKNTIYTTTQQCGP